MNKFVINILMLLSFAAIVKTQDTIDFKQFDSLKTYSEDNHENVNRNENNPGPLLTKKDPDNFDVRLFRSINNSRTKFKDDILPLFDKSAPPMTFFMPITAMVYGRFSENYYDENTGYLLGLSEGLNLFLTFGIKFAVHRDRPYVSLKKVYHRQDEFTDPHSFPSGHTSTAFAMSAMYNLRYPKYPQVYVPMYLYSLIVAYCRPYFGMHYPSDLLAGSVIGAGSSILVYSLRNHLFRFKNNILSENNEDIGSIDGNTIAIFGSAFIMSSIVGQLMMSENSKVMIDVSPFGNRGETLNMNVRIRF